MITLIVRHGQDYLELQTECTKHSSGTSLFEGCVHSPKRLSANHYHSIRRFFPELSGKLLVLAWSKSTEYPYIFKHSVVSSGPVKLDLTKAIQELTKEQMSELLARASR